MTKNNSFIGSLLSYLGLMVGLVLFYLIICVGYYNFHVRYQMAVRGTVDDGAAAAFGQRLFWFWALCAIIGTHIFNKYDWYESHPAFTEAFGTGLLVFLIIGVLGASAGRED